MTRQPIRLTPDQLSEGATYLIAFCILWTTLPELIRSSLIMVNWLCVITIGPNHPLFEQVLVILVVNIIGTALWLMGVCIRVVIRTMFRLARVPTFTLSLDSLGPVRLSQRRPTIDVRA